ncbi:MULTISPECIES: sugar ABC transporter ATP-binding protein [unclassified Oceanispirochaeta]|uniref:sugar ABC transporter ATP-binding protein n=1 Tax=unclassified Oceanispirochaeta TaxID=2635722 RepID=UPI000E096335|nr:MULTISPECIES: sugar ABC transporter ATP-binding protein [unclassified Oceanispirochaeta]MBF9015995.1 sugar ABC transporter ATP-binding protein [Oceanispirochaeta sp. M2]NPD72458.1 sugar ABC transporter ATP-binding protein [Oceanispirochaeta sp. M1]RDG31917.1 sugar ABC transporter ATP-binding protein [Oceanispirochaeta sp. M1]
MAENIILETRNISKGFPGVQALKNVGFSLHKGEVHALIGENGAGKSTLIKILTGAHQPDGGEIILEGEKLSDMNPHQAMSCGISAIYQEFNLIPYLTVAENMYFGREFTKSCFLDMEKMNKSASEIFASMGVDIDPGTQVSELSVAYKQLVEIAKAVSQNSRILIFDEPTAALTNSETENLFKLIKKLQNEGVSIIYISHRLEELQIIADRITVLRDGQYIDTVNIKDIDRAGLISLMVGRDLGVDFPKPPESTGDTVLEVRNMNTRGFLKDINFKLKKGEILGFGGLVGAGRTEIARALFGLDRLESGEILLNGSKVTNKNPGAAIANGIGLIPEDRKDQGVLLNLSIRENIGYTFIQKISDGIFINRRKEKKLVDDFTKRLAIKCSSVEQRVSNLSGGNQQKVVLAKWLAGDCDVLIFDEPTRGIDVGAKQEIYNLIRELAESGKGIILISSEMPELIGMSERIIVMHEGVIEGELTSEDVTQEKILDLASGSK